MNPFYCLNCGKKIPENDQINKTHCSPACKQKYYRTRKTIKERKKQGRTTLQMQQTVTGPKL